MKKTFPRIGFIFLVGIFSLFEGCSPKVPTGQIPADQQKSIDTSAVFSPMVDILFVIASDSSMSDFQAKLAANISKFTSEFSSAQYVDYHIGTISAQADNQGQGMTWGGRLKGGFVDRSTPNGDSIIRQNMNVGISSNDPVSPFATVRQALTSPIVDNENRGFLRPLASLAVVMITDTDPENTGEDADAFYQFLLNLKNGNAKQIFVYAATASKSQRCNGEAEPVLITKVLNLAKPNSLSMSLCDADFGTKLGQISKNIVNNIELVLYLHRAPVLSTIEVQFGSQIIPPDADKGWAYDADRDALVFGSHMVLSSSQPPGTQMVVKYVPTQFP